MAQRIEVPGMGVVEFPDGMTDEQIADAIKRNMPAEDARPPAQRFVQNALGGAIRGAGSIGATILTPLDMLLGNTQSWGNPERRAGMDGGLRELGIDTDSLAYGGTKLLAEIAGTAGVGGTLARGAAMIPGAAKAAPVLDAVRTGGFSAGGLSGAGGMAARTAGGTVTGAAAAGMVNPEDAGLGALIGGALPAAIKAAGATGRAIASPFRSQQSKAAESLLKAINEDPANVIKKMEAARELVPGSKPTLAQALQSPRASTLERIVSETPGGEALKDRYMAQNAARLGALDAVAPVDARGFRSAQQDFGEAALNAIRSGDKAAKAETRAAYQAVPQDEALLYLPDLAGVRDEFFPRGAFGGRAAVDQAVKAAEEVGSLFVEAQKAARKGAAPKTLAQAVRSAGGLSLTDNGGLRGEVADMGSNFKNLVRRQGGLTPSRMAERMREAGYLATDDTNELFDALKDEAMGRPVISMYDDPTKMLEAARDAAMGPPPGARRVPRKVTLGEFDAVRKSIGNAQRGAFRDPERATEAAALTRMKAAMDDRLNEVVRGDGAFDEDVPIAWADQLSKAQGLKRAQVEKFRTGPQALAFNTGADGLPSVQGGEFASKVWGQRPGIAEDIKVFKRVLDEKPELLGKFKSMVTTEGARTATNGGNLTGKFVRWVDDSLPGLKASFDPSEVKALQRIAEDIKRAERAAAVGAARGSPTYQNVSGAMSLGLLDSPLLNIAANRVPLVNQFSAPILESLRGSARTSQARELAGLLSGENIDQLPSLLGGGYLLPAPAHRGLLLGAPVLAAD